MLQPPSNAENAEAKTCDGKNGSSSAKNVATFLIEVRRE